MIQLKRVETDSFTRLIKSSAVFLYFILVVLHNLFQNRILDYVWYLVLIACFVLGILRPNFRISARVLVFAVVLLFSAALNIVFIGNTTVLDIVYTVLYFGIFFLLSDDKVDNRFILAALYFDCLIISFFLVRTGLGKAIFTTLSNNFVSVLLLLPASVFYIRQERFGKPISVVPAAAVLVTCLLATGRGGILVSGVLLFTLLFYHLALRKEWKRTRKYAMYVSGVVFITALLIVCFPFLLNVITSSAVFQRFQRFGMYGTGRMGIWEEYFSVMFQSPKRVLFGVKFSDLSLMVRYKNNLHNSFLNLHALYGLVFTVYVFILFAVNAVKCIRQKQWVYFFVLLVFLARAMTDRIFGGGQVATPVLLFLLFYLTDAPAKDLRHFSGVGKDDKLI